MKVCKYKVPCVRRQDVCQGRGPLQHSLMEVTFKWSSEQVTKSQRSEVCAVWRQSGSGSGSGSVRFFDLWFCWSIHHHIFIFSVTAFFPVFFFLPVYISVCLIYFYGFCCFTLLSSLPFIYSLLLHLFVLFIIPSPSNSSSISCFSCFLISCLSFDYSYDKFSVCLRVASLVVVMVSSASGLSSGSDRRAATRGNRVSRSVHLRACVYVWCVCAFVGRWTCVGVTA